MALIGYARVSTADQDTALQTDALRKADCERIFEDTASGAKADRPGLADALAYMRDGDVLAVWRLDRLGRSMPHLIETIGAMDDARRRLPFAHGSNRHHHARRAAHFSCFWRAGPVRARSDPRAHQGWVDSCCRSRAQAGITADKLQQARKHIANGLNVREAATRLKVSKTALYTALQSAHAASPQ